jgi:hypothetical protein
MAPPLNKFAATRAARDYQQRPYSDRYWRLQEKRARVEQEFIDACPREVRDAINERGFDALDDFRLPDCPQLRAIQEFFRDVPIYDLLADAKQE